MRVLPEMGFEKVAQKAPWTPIRISNLLPGGRKTCLELLYTLNWIMEDWKKFAIYTKIQITNLDRPFYQLVRLERFKSRQICNLKNYWPSPASSTFWSAPCKNPNQGTNLICKHLEHKVCQSSLWFDVAVCTKKSKQDYVNVKSAIIFFIYLCWAFLLWIIFAQFWKLLFLKFFEIIWSFIQMKTL